jgi:hypothetical protein
VAYDIRSSGPQLLQKNVGFCQVGVSSFSKNVWFYKVRLAQVGCALEAGVIRHCYLLWSGTTPPFRLLQKSKVLSGWRAPTFAAVRREVEKTSVFLWGAGELQAGQIDRGFPWFR